MPKRGEYKAPSGGPDVPDTHDGARDDVLLLAIMAGATYRQAAERTGMSLRTVERRMADPSFKRRVLAARREQQQRSLTILAGAVPIGLQALTIAASGWEEVRWTDSEGNERTRREPVPWTARIQAAAKLVELGVGSLARVQVEVSDAPDRTEVEADLAAKLEEYAQRAPEPFRLLMGGAGEEGVPASEQVIEATGTEAQPAPPRRERPRARRRT